jgi:hypothetical protein
MTRVNPVAKSSSPCPGWFVWRSASGFYLT